MGPRRNHIIADEKGLAMVLAVSFVALLSTMAVWMILQSKSSMQMTKAFERTEATMQLAQGALWRVVRYLDTVTPVLPTTRALQPMTTSASYLAANQAVGDDGYMTPVVRSGRDFYNTLPPEGWMLNEPARYFTKFYEGYGLGEKRLTGARGSARARLYNFVEKVAR